MPLPTGIENPQSPAYDRKKNVNFILDTMIDDIDNGCPPDSFVVMDALNLLDTELLDSFLTVDSGEALEKILDPHSEAGKIQRIKDAGKASPTIKSWVTRVVVTIQDEYRRAVGQAEEAPAAQPQPSTPQGKVAEHMAAEQPTKPKPQ